MKGILRKSSVKLSLPLLVVLIFFSHCSSGSTLNQLLEKGGQGNVAAKVQLASMYKDGQDYAEALKWYQKAADKGDSGAQVNIGVMYLKGNGVKQNHDEAMKLWTKAANMWNTTAMTYIGVTYFKGDGVKQNYGEAMNMKWYKKAADLGDADALVEIGVLYKEGKGVEKDNVTAYAYWNAVKDSPCLIQTRTT